MNRVFLTGRLKVKPEVMLTPKGEKIVRFPLWVEDGSFSIDVIYLDRQGIENPDRMAGNTVMVSGTLAKSPGGGGPLKVKAHKISWMEE